MKLSIKQYTTRCWPPVLYNKKPNPSPWGDPDPHLTQCSMAHTSPCAKHPAGRIMPHHGSYIMIIQTFWSDFSSHCGILANIGYQDPNYVRRRRYIVCPSDELVRDGFKQVAAAVAVVSIIRYPGKHESASQESLLSLFGPPSLLANDNIFYYGRRSYAIYQMVPFPMTLNEP